MEAFFSQLHFIRPAWFYAFIPLLFISYALIRAHKQGRSWTKIIDPKLLPYLLVGQSVKKTSINGLLVFIAGTLAILSLAGPAWEKRPQPVFKDKSALVIALDLSSSMDAADIKPSRLTRAKHKIIDILKQRKLGQTALLVYAGSAFVVTPLTDDTTTITSLLESLTTDLMPAQGTRTDKALRLASSLLKNADVRQGDILLVTDSIENEAENNFKVIAQQHRISILAVATTQGGPIPLASGGFLKDRSGNIVIPKLDIENFKHFSNISNGRFSTLSVDDRDVKIMTSLFNQSHISNKNNSRKTKLKTDIWYEQGAWLLLFLIPVAALAFRRGIIFVFVFFILQPPQYVEASGLWDTLWKNTDQRASEQLKKNNPAEAARLFKDKQWKAASYYKNKQYDKTIDTLKNIDTADAHYNAGNAYAKLGQLDKAIDEYNKSIKLNPKHEDAIYNKKILEKRKQGNKKQNSSNKNSHNKKKNKSQQKNKSKNDNKQKNAKKGNDKKQSDSTKKEQSGNKSDSNDNKLNKKKNKDKNKAQSNRKDSDKTKRDQKDSDREKQEQAKSIKKENKLSEQQKQKMKQQHITKQWLRRIPDDPGGLLRNKFKYQYQRQQNQQSEQNNW